MNKVDQIQQLLELVVNAGASDLHLKVPRPPVLRINGVLSPQDDLPQLTAEEIEEILREITTEEQRLEFFRTMSLDFTYSVEGLARFRVSALKQRGTISLAFRIIPWSVPSIEELGLPQICKKIISKQSGLVLVTGTAGSGKSTTLAAMINYINETEARSIITIEDPIEFLIPDKKCVIRQQELGSDTRSFSKALINALRHDPDIIIIGELRDPDTIMTAITAAETGHLVIGTLHTIDAAQSIDRIIDVFPSSQQRQIRLQLSQVLDTVLSQTLVLNKNNKRTAVFEIMIMTSVISRLIREEKIYEIAQNIEMCRHDGMQTMAQGLATLVKNDLISEEEALKKLNNPSKLRDLLKANAGY